MNKLSQYIVAGDKLDSSPGSSPLASFPGPSPRGGGGGGGEGLVTSLPFILQTMETGGEMRV